MKLAQVLFSQGFGSRRECEGLILGGFVSVAGAVMDDPFDELDPEGLQFSVRGETWPFRTKALIVLNKPAGHECSQKPKHHPSVYSLLGAPLHFGLAECHLVGQHWPSPSLAGAVAGLCRDRAQRGRALGQRGCVHRLQRDSVADMRQRRCAGRSSRAADAASLFCSFFSPTG